MYNVGVIDTIHSYTAGSRSVLFANGAKIQFDPPASGTTVPTSGTPVIYHAHRLGFPMLLQWDYDASNTYGHFEVIMKDRTHWITGSLLSAPGSVCPLVQIMDRNGNSIYFNYGSTSVSAASYGYPLLSKITTGFGGTGISLLTIQRVTDGSGSIVSVSDSNGRSVYYHNSLYNNLNVPSQYPTSYQEVDQVSQIVPTGTTNPASRWAYGYDTVFNDQYYIEKINLLHTISVPSPTSSGASTSYIWYSTEYSDGAGNRNPDPNFPSPLYPFVSALVDGNGNRRLYSGYPNNNPSPFTQVKVENSSGTVIYSYSVSFDTNMNELARTDGAGNTLFTITYDTLKPYSPATIKDGNGNTWNYTWDSYGNMLTEAPPSNSVRTPAVTTNTYSYTNFALGELTQTQVGTKSPTKYTYFEPSGLVNTITAPLPGTVGGSTTVATSFTYDSLGNVLTITRPGNNAASAITTTFNYTTDGGYSQSDAIGQPLTITNNLGKVTHLRYDAQGNTLSVTDALGNETDMTYTISNQSLTTALPATGQTGTGRSGVTNAYLYAPTTSANPTLWPVSTLQYGPLLSATTQDEGNVGAIRQVSYTYGKEGETLSVSGSTEPVSYTYDALYRLSTLTDGGGHATSYFYNIAGYLYQVANPGASATPPTVPLTVGAPDTVSFPSYDGEGNATQRVDGNNVTTTYTYSADPESLLTAIAYPVGTIGNVAFTYDAYGRRSAMTDGTGGQTYTYDDQDNLLTKTVTWTGVSSIHAVSYAFYPDGSQKTMSAAGKTFTYTYDGVGRMAKLVNTYAQAFSWAYYDNGWLHTQTLGNGVTTTYTPNALGQTTDLLNQTGGATPTTLSEFGAMRYDGAGNRVSVTAAAPSPYAGVTTYQYDSAQTANPSLNRSQLTQETSTRNGSSTKGYAYDGGAAGGPGNPTSFQGTTNTFNADNQTTGTGYGYDGNGNPTTDKGVSLAFDPENRLIASGTAATFGYDGDGLRVWKQNSAGTRSYYLCDGSRPVIEFLPTGSTFAINTFGATGLLARQVSAGSAYYTFDERGNVAQRTNSAGTVTSSDLYDGFGKLAAGGTVGDAWGFGAQAGYYTVNETGLLLLTHRYYDPANGRLLTRDPISFNGGINLYGYVRNNPINRADPSGHSGAGGVTIESISSDLSGDPRVPIGGVMACAYEYGALKTEIGLMQEPDPTLGGIFTDGILQITAGIGFATAGYVAIVGGSLLVGALGAFVLSGGLVVVAIGSIAVGAAIYNYTHPPVEEQTESCVPSPCSSGDGP